MKMTKGDVAVIMGDKWAKKNIDQGKDKLNVSLEDAPAAWIQLALKKMGVSKMTEDEKESVSFFYDTMAFIRDLSSAHHSISALN